MDQHFRSDSLTIAESSALEVVGICYTLGTSYHSSNVQVEDPGPNALVMAGERLDRLGVTRDILVRFGIVEWLATDILGPGWTLPLVAAARTLALAGASGFLLAWPNLVA